MASATTLYTMMLQAIRRGNVQNFVGATDGIQLISYVELRDVFNEYAAEFVDMLIAARGQEYLRKAYTLATTANVAQYSLPPDFYELISVDIYIAPNQVLSARPYQEAQRNQFRWYPGWFYNTPVLFRMQGTPTTTSAVLQPGTINFTPQPSSVATIVLNYVPAFRKWATDGSEDNYQIDGVNGWDAWLVWKVAAYCKEKMEVDSSYCLARAEELKARIIDMAVDREAGDAEIVHDVAADYEPFGWGGI